MRRLPRTVFVKRGPDDQLIVSDGLGLLIEDERAVTIGAYLIHDEMEYPARVTTTTDKK